jgi:hypothetical protein
MKKEKKQQLITEPSNVLYTLLGVVYRLIYLLVAPIFMIYMLFPPLWIFGIPYWIITDRDLMKDCCKMYGV